MAITGGQLWLAFLAGLQTAAILAGERVWRAVPVAAVAMAVMVGLDLVLVPAFGAIGAAAATVAGTVVMVAAFGWFLEHASGLRTPRPSLRVLAAGLLSALVAARLASAGLVPAAITAAAVYCVVLLGTRVVRRADVVRLRLLMASASRGAPA
jgi:peptidoglycan biosynthesis protein MviN/MurJ (putative lipid II flippase)